MLSNADEYYGHIGGMYQTDKSTNHVTHSVTLGDDEAIEGPDGTEGGVEVSRLSD